MSRYRFEESRDERLGQLWLLADEESGATATVAPGCGANLCRLSVPVEGRPLDVLLAPEPWRDATHFGVPVLFPFPNRLRHGQFGFMEKSYQLIVQPNGNSIHGLVRDRSWRMVSVEPSPLGASLVASFDSREHDDVIRQFPFPFRLEVTFTLSGSSVRILAEATNLGEGPMPMGFGLHPWFRLPLVPEGSRERCRLLVTAARQWVLDEKKLPTGETIPVPPDRDFRTDRALGSLQLDDVYTDIPSSGECAFVDPDAGARVGVAYDSAFRELVVFAPGHIPTVCLEPYSCPTDAFNLESRGIDSGVVVLGPGQVWRGGVVISVESR